MAVFVDAHMVFAQDAPDSGTKDAVDTGTKDAAPDSSTKDAATDTGAKDASADSGTKDATDSATKDATDSSTNVEADWNPVDEGPAIDEDAASAAKVLEIPQARCSNDEDSSACDANASTNPNDDDGGISAPSPGAPPQNLDQDTASNAQDADWGTVDEYQNQEAYNVPYALYPYPYAVNPYQANGIGAFRPSVPGYAPLSSPLTQASRPPLNQGPWMTRPTMSQFSRPAGSPMAPMMMSAPLAGFHH
jgi:hypothetical protein